MTSDSKAIDGLLANLNITGFTWETMPLEEDKKAVLKKHLLLIAKHSETLSIDRNMLIQWEAVFLKGEAFSKACPDQTAIAKFAAGSNTTMTSVYAIFNGLGFAMALFSLAHGHISPELAVLTGVLVAGQTWNHIDSIFGYAVALDQYMDGKYVEASISTVSTTQLLAATLTGILGHYAFHTVGATVAVGLLGFSFAGCMFLAAGIEGYLMYESKLKIDALNEKILTTKDPNEKVELEKLILLERANYNDQKRNAHIWLACGASMLAIAFISINVATFGAPLVAMAIVTGVTFATAIWRAFCLDKNPHMEQLKSVDVKQLNQWFDVLDKAYFQDNQAILDIKDKIADLFQTNPDRAAQVVEALDKHLDEEILNPEEQDCLEFLGLVLPDEPELPSTSL